MAYCFESKNSLCMVLSLMEGGTLKYRIHNIGDVGLSEAQAVFYAAEIICGILYLHSSRIAHR